MAALEAAILVFVAVQEAVILAFAAVLETAPPIRLAVVAQRAGLERAAA